MHESVVHIRSHGPIDFKDFFKLLSNRATLKKAQTEKVVPFMQHGSLMCLEKPVNLIGQCDQLLQEPIILPCECYRTFHASYQSNRASENHQTYRTNSKNWDTNNNNYPNCPKTGVVWFYNAVTQSKDAHGMENSAGPDQTVPLGAV